MWQPGEEWRPVKSLLTLEAQIRAYAPRAVPPATDVASWGFLADDAHSSSSDHYPHYYAALGPIAVVCASDTPHAPALGLDIGVIWESLRISRDPRIGYLIFNRRITGPNHGWQWEPYTGTDPHDTHGHCSTVHTEIADDGRPWALPGRPEQTGEKIMFLRNPANSSVYLAAGGGIVPVSASEWQDTQPGSERGIDFVNMPASLIAKAVAASGKVIDPAVMVAALVPVLAPALAAALPAQVDAAAVIAAFDDEHVRTVLAEQAEAGIRAL
jgi:hypothetical protein